MGDLNWQYIIDGAAALYGLYVFLSAVKMKLTGEISSFVASPEELYKCKDKQGFIRAVYGWMTAFGLITLFYGGANIVNSFLWNDPIFNLISLAVFLLACVKFIFLLHRARKKYLNL